MALTVPLKLDDLTDQVYLERDPKNRYRAMEKTLERFKNLDPSRRYLILEPDQVKDLENYLREQVASPEALTSLIKKLTTVVVGDVKVPLTDLQRATIAERAAYWEKDPQEYLAQELERAVNHMCFGTYTQPIT